MPGTADTIFMVSISSLFAISIGLGLGVVLYITQPGGVCEITLLNKILGTIVNIGRSIPFVIIIIAVFPLSRFIVGTSIGRTAAIVPLTIAAIPFVARLVEANLNELGQGIVEAAVSAGATPMQIIFRVLLPESASSLVSSFTLTIISLIGYSAMAGTIGGGGLGDVALRHGYQRFRTDILILTVLILVILVQFIQIVGQIISKRLDKR
ncbi:MAG: ABC transporter permease [Defluviitaleaceae bacterium]|nr:ABC transporter permease [Defluviitaleaceae bacterium]